MSADVPETWEELARAAIADLRRYAHDETPSRRLVSACGYEVILQALETGVNPLELSESELEGYDRWGDTSYRRR